YGVANPEWWRFLEHAGWVVFEDVFLIWSCVMGRREIESSALREAQIEELSEQEQLKTAALQMALAEMQTATAGRLSSYGLRGYVGARYAKRLKKRSTANPATS